MSTINNKVLLHELNIPALNSVGYADGLDNALIAIDNNISLLANSDFLKGSQGDSINIEKVDLTKQPVLFNKLKQAILNGVTPRPINGVNWDAYLSTELYVINSVVSNGVESVSTPISSLYYTFVDARYVNKFVGTVTDFGNERDLSCVLTYDGSKFNRINAFPTMYYERGVGLCWMVNGQKTGLPVQGIPGNDGKNSDILIVRVDGTPDTDGKGRVDKVWTKGGGWEPINDPSDYDGYSCFALAPKYKTDDNGQLIIDSNGQYQMDSATSFYIGKLTSQNSSLYVVCKPELSLQQTFGAAVFIEAMQNISLLQNSDTIVTPKGIFVPMKTLGDLKVGEPQPIHIISATSINNEQGNYEENMTDMIITPVNTTDIVVDGDRNLKVDKYLYVKLSDEVRNAVGMSDTVICKYKLENIVLTENIVKPYTENDDCFLLKGEALTNGELDYDKVVSIINYNNLIPDDYRQRIRNGYGIYQWVLVQDSDDFDPDNTYTGGNTKIALYLNNIYTKSMTPGLGDEILWFNSLIVDNDNLEGDYDHDFEPDYSMGGTASTVGEWETPTHIGGWEDDWDTTISENVILYRGVDFKSLKFEKFVPVYDNHYKVKRDTSLNINYNVNITGDEDNPKKNLSVHGDVNCDNLNVYELTATKEIKNIKTNDDIYGKGGIRLADDKFVVDDEANVVSHGSMDISDSVNALDLSSDTGIASGGGVKFIKRGKDYLIKTNTPKLDFDNTQYNEDYNQVSRVETEEIVLDVDKLRNINLNRGEDVKQTWSYKGEHYTYIPNEVFPTISSDLAQHTNDATITVSVNKTSRDIYKHPNPGESNWFTSAQRIDAHLSSNGAYGGENRYCRVIKGQFDFDSNSYSDVRDISDITYSQSYTNNLSLDSHFNPDLESGSTSYYVPKNVFSTVIPKDETRCETRGLTLRFMSPLNFVVFTDARCHKGGWPQMKSSSFVQLDVFALVGGTFYKCKTSSSLDGIMPDIASGKIRFGFTDTDSAWYGVEHQKGEYNVIRRSYSYSILPDTISLNTVDNTFLTTSDEIILYVIPSYHIEFESSTNTMKSLGISAFRPSVKDYSVSSFDGCRRTSISTNKFIQKLSQNIIPIDYTFYTTVSTPYSGMKSLTICPDGISIHNDNEVIGIGFVDEGGYSIPVLRFKSDNYGNFESIPIKGLAEMYKWYKQTH
jgi:hypothetical protein